MMNKERFTRVVEEMKRQGLTQILIADDPAIFWLTGRIVNPMERCGAILLKDDGEVHAFMNNLFCFAPIDGMTMHYYADGENPYKLLRTNWHQVRLDLIRTGHLSILFLY